MPERLWTLYHIRLSNSEECFEKIGITSKSVQERFRTECGLFFKNYEMKILEIKRLPKDECKLEEKRLHKIYKEISHTPYTDFSGKTECFVSGFINIKDSK